MARADGGTAARVTMVVNGGSGGGKVARYGLVDRATSMGAEVRVVTADLNAATLARMAVDQGAEVLGVAGGDGTVSAVATVAAESDRPLVVVPAGTRNHFARDLGLDIKNPALALNALLDAESVRVDLGTVDAHAFVNNVSFGIYAEALLDPQYRDAKARTFVSIAPRYLEGQQWVEATVEAPGDAIEHPQVVLVSNNVYHLATPQNLGRRFTLSAGILGAVVIKRPADRPPPPDLVARLRDELRHHGISGVPSVGIISWSAPAVELYGHAPQLPAGIDGESKMLTLPVRCEIRPGALRVLLPRQRPRIPKEPTRGRRRASSPKES